MTDPNVNTLWGRIIVDELVQQGIDSVCLAPGSRSTPLVVAVSEHPEIEVYSHLDERSAAFFALGRAKQAGRPTPVISTSGTAAANFHPAVIEADTGRVPMLLLTADRPPELHDSGANQTIDQKRLYGDAPRWYRTLPEPGVAPRKLRMLRTTIARATDRSRAIPAGPVHLNVPFSKPLAPVESEQVPERVDTEATRDVRDRTEPYVRMSRGRQTLETGTIESIAEVVRAADRGLIVVGPTGESTGTQAVAELGAATGFPVFADPLSGLRYGRTDESVTVCGGYDGYLDTAISDSWPDPDVVLRFGAAPTSARLETFLGRIDARRYLIDPAGWWPEATFTATDRLEVEPAWFARELGRRVDRDATDWGDRIGRIESTYWETLEATGLPPECQVIADVIDRTPAGSVVFVSNSMPVRDLDRFGRPTGKPLTVLGNRGASGIDGVTSTALGAGSAAAGELVIVTGDLAFYHDMNGLLAIGRCGIDATIVLVNNDGGGIFHMLPIEAVDPPFTELFKTPHGLDFSPTADLYALDYERPTPDQFAETFATSVETNGATVIEVKTDAADNHHHRDHLEKRVVEALT